MGVRGKPGGYASALVCDPAYVIDVMFNSLYYVFKPY